MLAWLASAGIALLAAPHGAVAQGKSGGKGKSGNSNAGGNSGGNSGNAKGKGATKPGKGKKAAATVLDHDAALAAVRNGKAQPLGALLPRIERRYGGEVIDAALQRAGRRLVYALKILSPEGRVFIIAVDAVTGRPNNDVEFFGL
jgi:hypothetical protein